MFDNNIVRYQLYLCKCNSSNRPILVPSVCVMLTDEHLIHDHTQRPPVAQFVVPRLHEHFRSDVVWRSHSGISLKVTPDER